jgi:hypothetical protein
VPAPQNTQCAMIGCPYQSSFSSKASITASHINTSENTKSAIVNKITKREKLFIIILFLHIPGRTIQPIANDMLPCLHMPIRLKLAHARLAHDLPNLGLVDHFKFPSAFDDSLSHRKITRLLM